MELFQDAKNVIQRSLLENHDNVFYSKINVGTEKI